MGRERALPVQVGARVDRLAAVADGVDRPARNKAQQPQPVSRYEPVRADLI